MNRKRTAVISAALMSLGTITFAGAPAGLNGQVSKDRSDVKAEGAQSSADAKEVKRLSDLSAQATGRSRQAHEVYVQKVAAHKAAVKSFGAKDSRAEQASKDEEAAKQEWTARMKEQQDVSAQRKAAIEKLHSADVARNKDVHQLESDQSQGHPKPAAPPKQ